MMPENGENIEQRRDRKMENERDAAQKAKLVFLSLATAVGILLIVSFVYANKMRSERNAAQKEIEVLKQDNAKLSQWLEERTKENEALKKQIDRIQSKPKAAKAATKKKAAPAKSASKKKPSKTTKSR